MTLHFRWNWRGVSVRQILLKNREKTKTNCSIFSTISAQLIRSPDWDQTISLRLSFGLSREFHIRAPCAVACDCIQHEMPVIFLPTHRSHLDYVLISFILFTYNIRTPHVAAGDNLLIPFFGFVVHHYYHCHDHKIVHKVSIDSLQNVLS